MLLIKQLGVGLNILHFRIKQILTECFRRHGLQITPEQFIVLDTLWDEGAMSQQKLANIISKDKNSVTKLVDGLEKRNLIRRTQCDTDRRVNIVELTDEANQIKEQATRTAVCCLNTLLKGIKEEDVKIAVEVFDKINQNILEIERKTNCYGTTFR